MATEEPLHSLVFKSDQFEVRDYPSLIAAEVLVTGERSEAISAGFRLLAGYIFGGNTGRQSIAMTAPVLQTKPNDESSAMTTSTSGQTPDGKDWVIRFMMPSSYALASLPTPNDPKVHLLRLPPRRFAVVRFSGLAGEASIVQHTAELNTFITGQQLRSSGTAVLARYDPPWTPWFMRRNEVMIPVEADGAR